MSYCVTVDFKGEEVLVVVTHMEYIPEQPQTRYQEYIPEHVEIEAGYCVSRAGEVDFDSVLEEVDIQSQLLALYKQEDAEMRVESRL
jgi:hypothetical protein